MGFIRINEGDGSNLLPEDEEQGFVDYIMVDDMVFDGLYLTETGNFSVQVMLEEAYQEKFKTPEDVIQHVGGGGGGADVEYMILDVCYRGSGRYEKSMDNSV